MNRKLEHCSSVEQGTMTALFVHRRAGYASALQLPELCNLIKHCLDLHRTGVVFYAGKFGGAFARLRPSKENQDYSYKFFITTTDKQVGNQENQAWTSGTAPDGHGQFEPFIAGPLEGAGEPNLGFGRPDTFGQKEQAVGSPTGMMEKGKDLLSRITHPDLMSDKD